MASFWDKFESGIQNFQDFLFPPPEKGYFSLADSVRFDRLKRIPIINKDQSEFADNIKSAAWDLIGTETYTRSFKEKRVCATAACQIFNKANIPWPTDKYGNSTESIDYVIDAFDGRGEPGKLFTEHSGDFKPVGPGELAKGDMLILDVDYSPYRLWPSESDLENFAEVDQREPGYQKHMAIITDIYENGVEVVHDRGPDEPKSSKFYTFDFLYGDKDNAPWFDRAYRYSPNVDNRAFQHLVYGSE